jgi:ABC-2 type transport system ATP-binding protein
MNDRAVIETAGLWKRYDDVEALRGLDLQVPSGSIFGFLGRNGAGRRRRSRSCSACRARRGRSPRLRTLIRRHSRSGVEIRRRTAFVSDEKDLYDYMTVGEIVAFTRSFYPKWRGDLEQQYLRQFDLQLSRDIKGLSRGMRTKLAMLLALCQRRRVVDPR